MSTIHRRVTGSFTALPAHSAINPSHGRFKGPHNTGIPLGTILSKPEYGFTASTNNAVYEDRVFYSGITIAATGVVFRRCIIYGRNALYVATVNSGYATFEDCLIDGGDYLNTEVTVVASNMTIRRCEVRGGSDCMRIASNALVEDSWIHSPTHKTGSHSDILQTIGSTNSIVRRNNLDGRASGINASFQFGGNFTSALTNLVVEDNYFNGGNYTINGEIPVGGTAHFTGNRFGPTFQFGRVVGAVKNDAATWSNNVQDLTGTTV